MSIHLSHVSKCEYTTKHIHSCPQMDVNGSTCVVIVLPKLVVKRIPFANLGWIREFAALARLRSTPIATHSRYIIQFIGKCSHVENGVITSSDLYFPRLHTTLQAICSERSASASFINVNQIIIDTIAAVAHCHRQNVWHRDIKPDNIMVSKTGRATLIDFGQAVIYRQNMTLDCCVSYYCYRAPEVHRLQLRQAQQANAYDEKIDVWSLGVVLIELATNKSILSMFPSGTEVEFTRMIVLNPNQFALRLSAFYVEHTQLSTKYNWLLNMIALDPKDRPHMIELLHRVRTQFLTEHCNNTDLALDLIAFNNTWLGPNAVENDIDAQHHVSAELITFIFSAIAHYVEVLELSVNITRSWSAVHFMDVAGLFNLQHERLPNTLAYCLIVSAGVFDDIHNATIAVQQITEHQYFVPPDEIIAAIDRVMQCCGAVLLGKMMFQ